MAQHTGLDGEVHAGLAEHFRDPEGPPVATVPHAGLWASAFSDMIVMITGADQATTKVRLRKSRRWTEALVAGEVFRSLMPSILAGFSALQQLFHDASGGFRISEDEHRSRSARRDP